MVLYFSGTGNSQLVAFQIANLIGDEEVISMNKYIKAGKPCSFCSKRELVFVMPTYCWRIPKVVEQWITKNEFQCSNKVYFILTCGDSSGNAIAYTERLCRKKNLVFGGLGTVVMPENYLLLYPTPDKEKSREIIEKAKPQISMYANMIKGQENLPNPRVTFRDLLKSGPVHPLFYTFIVRDSGFKVSERCISCGKCVMRCPVNNLAMKDGKPVWKGKCTHCVACISGCPTEAIQYKKRTQERNKHYMVDDLHCYSWKEKD